MTNQEEPYGLTLMDVLINTLLLAMVLMMIAAAFIEPIKTENVPDPATGGEQDPTELVFAPVPDPVRAGCDLNLTFELVGGNPANVKLRVRKRTGNIPKDSIQVLSGVFDRQYWHINRPCWSDLTIYGDWEVVLTADGIADLPRAVLLHGVRGLRPIRFPERRITLSRQLKQSLLTIFGDSNVENQMPKISL